jgi:hypothetical protein
MTALRRGVGAWHSFWFRPADPRALALCRILFFAMLLALYGREDFTFVAPLAALHWDPVSFFEIVAPAGPPSARAIEALQIVWRISLVAALAGVATRVSTAVACMVGIYLIGLTLCVSRTSHEMAAASIALVILALSRCGDVWSVDALVARRRAARPAPAPSGEYRWPIQLVRVVISLAFFGAGLSKLRGGGGLGWIFSDTLQLTLADRALPLGLAIAQWPWLCRGLAAGVVLVELLHPLALVSRRAACVLVPGSVLLLLGFWLGMGIPFWPLLGLHAFWIPWDAVFAGAQLQRCSSAPSPSR